MDDAIVQGLQGRTAYQVLKYKAVFNFTQADKIRAAMALLKSDLPQDSCDIFNLKCVTLFGPAVFPVLSSLIISNQGIIIYIKKVLDIVKSYGPDAMAIYNRGSI